MLYPDEILLQAEKPARYIGREINAVKKDPAEVAIRFAFCFPDSYEVGMSHLGMQILYYFLNRREDVFCERVFAPWVDMEKLLRENALPLVTLESYDPLYQFDFVGFTLQYEMSYTNLLNMLELGGIPLLSKERGEEHPFVVAGGPCACNPEPLADFVDFFYIGEGEAMLDRVLELYKEHKKEKGTRQGFLEKIASLTGIYVPSFYDVSYNTDGTISAFLPNNPHAPAMVKRALVEDMDNVFFPDRQLVPLIETVHDRVSLEVFRGCIRGCRFCQAGYIYRPVREKTASTLLCQGEKLIAASGHEEISLVSLSTGDYSQFKDLSSQLVDQFAGENVNISLPSLRIDAFNLELMTKVQSVRRSSLTFAPEAGSQRLRDVINKNITEDEILNGCALAFSGGWDRVKLYFMIGLPTETQEDIQAIGELAGKITDQYYQLPKERRNRPVSVIVSASCFVPKPFTPFQWEPQNTMEEFSLKQQLLKRSTTKKQIKINCHESNISVLEGVIARGDRNVSKVILAAFRLGARFDGWSDMFRFDIWKTAFEKTGLSMEFYAQRKRDYDEILPWDFIDIGITKTFLLREMENAKAAKTTPDCRSLCSGCGAAVLGGGGCREN